MSKKKVDTGVSSAGAALAKGLVLVAALGPQAFTPEQLADLEKSLGELGHMTAPPYSLTHDDDRFLEVPANVSNVANIMTAQTDGVLLMPDWVENPQSRTEVFAAINMGVKLYALGVGDGVVLVEISHWGALMTLASIDAFKEAAAIYAPLP